MTAATSLSVVLPSYNRARCLARTLRTYADAAGVSEIVCVLDGSTDDSLQVIDRVRATTSVPIVVISNPRRLGALACREIGVRAASNAWVMFGEDDVLLDPEYPRLLLETVTRSGGLASGRIVYLRDGEAPADGKSRFVRELQDEPFIQTETLTCNLRSRLPDESVIPFSHALYAAPKALLLRLGFDHHYSKGTGYREETDTQMLAYLQGIEHRVRSEAMCYHMAMAETRQGGQRTNALLLVFHNVVLNNYFLNKHHRQLAERMPTLPSRLGMQWRFAARQVRVQWIRRLQVTARSWVINLAKKVLRRVA